MSNSEKYCSVYIASDEIPMTQQEIQAGLAGPRLDDRIKALKALVKQIINDEAFPRLVMVVIQNLVPIQSESHQLKKILLFYWEVIEKVNSNGILKDEMILVCNSLRNDLLHPNEYIRGRTLKLVSRILYKGILEPLQSAIVENIKHKNIYVRRNAVVCLYEIYLNFGDDLISDLDEMMEALLNTEQDISTKRNAFLLLFHANQQKALQYLDDQQQTEFGDIMQIAILELFRKVCKAQPLQKPKLLKCIFNFSKSRSPSVLLECANTLISVSPSTTSLRIAIGIYMSLAQTQTDNNVKLIVLERLENVKDQNPKALQEHVLDITALLQQQSVDIRKKVLSLLGSLVRSEVVHPIIAAISKELQKIQNESDEASQEFRQMLLQALQSIIQDFPQSHESITQVILDSIAFNQKLDDNSANLVYTILNFLNSSPNRIVIQRILRTFQQRFFDIQHILIFKCGFSVLGNSEKDDDQKAFNEIKRAIGSLPLEIPKQINKQQNSSEQKSEQTNEDNQQQKKQKVKTVILPDGTYGTQIVTEDELSKVHDLEQQSKLREYLIGSSFLAPSLCRTLLKLLLLIPQNQYNKYASQALMIFCALVRFYQQNINRVDQDAVEKVHNSIRVLTNQGDPIQNITQYLSQTELIEQKIFHTLVQQNEQSDKPISDNKIIKQPDDLIVYRQLKQGGQYDIDLGDEEINEDIFSGRNDQQNFVQKLIHLVQLTGYGDPIYAEAFVDIHKYDIVFDVLLVNRSPKMVQNIQVEFRTAGECKVLEKPQNVTLQPNAQQRVRTSIKFSSADLGLIHGAIHYENNAGVEQPYLITKEINIDMMDFIYAANIDIGLFRKKWAKYEWENRISINTNQTDLNQFIHHIEKSLKMQRVNQNETQQQEIFYVSANLYAKTKLDDDFLINLSAEKGENKINGFIRIRSKVKGIVVNLGERIKQIQLNADI